MTEQRWINKIDNFGCQNEEDAMLPRQLSEMPTTAFRAT